MQVTPKTLRVEYLDSNNDVFLLHQLGPLFVVEISHYYDGSTEYFFTDFREADRAFKDILKNDGWTPGYLSLDNGTRVDTALYKSLLKQTEEQVEVPYEVRKDEKFNTQIDGCLKRLMESVTWGHTQEQVEDALSRSMSIKILTDEEVDEFLGERARRA